MTEDRISAHGVTVTITRSAGADDAVVVYVDTEGLPGPECRILLNDEPARWQEDVCPTCAGSGAPVEDETHA